MSTTITGLTAVTAPNLTDAAVFEVEDVNVDSRKATLAQVRVALAVGRSIVRAHAAANQLLLTATLTPIVFGTELWDLGANFASSTYTAPGTVRKRIAGQLFYTGSGGLGQRMARVYLNGAVYSYHVTSPGAFDASVPFDVTLDLVVTDTIEIYGYQDSTFSINVETGAGKTYIEIFDA